MYNSKHVAVLEPLERIVGMFLSYASLYGKMDVRIDRIKIGGNRVLKKDYVALTPPMGWNSWDCYGPAITEADLIGNAEYMEKHLKEYGWEYVINDIQWSEPSAGTKGWDYNAFAELTMDEYGRQMPAINRFPSAKGGLGFKPIADKIHAMGLKYGIHIMRGVPRLAVHKKLPVYGMTRITCDQIAHSSSVCRWNSDMYGIDATKEGAQEYYNSIFSLYASWGVDYVKVDDICNTNAYPHNPYSAEKEIELIRRAIDSCGRPMVLSLSPGAAVIEKSWHLSRNANMWRITDDFWDRWDLLKEMFTYCEIWQKHVSPGCFPDCYMLPLGQICITTDGVGHWTNFTKEEQQTMLTLWSIFRSPLILGAELRKNDEWTLSLLTNKEVLRLNKHSFGARQIDRNDKEAIWTSEDVDGSKYLALFNLSDCIRTVSVNLEEVELHSAELRDLWKRENLGLVNGRVSAILQPHESKLYRVR